MKTTNIFIDFIVAGVLGITAFALPVCMIWHRFTRIAINHSDLVIRLTPVLTIVTYAFGVVFNQIADRVNDLLHRLPWLHDVVDRRRLFQDEYGVTDHDCVQFIVTASAEAYEYLSFRRAVIRIIRSVVAAQIIVLLLHPVIGLTASVAVGTEFSWTNTAILAIDAAFLPFTLYTLRKLELGYFAAVKSFYSTLRNKQG